MRYFGEFAPRPYLLVKTNLVMDDNLARQIIECSFYETPVDNVEYTRYFVLEEGEVIQFEYGLGYGRGMIMRFLDGFRKVTV